MTVTYTAPTEADTRRLGERLSDLLRAGDLIFLTGDLGAGKSVMARGIARGLGIEGPMPSPTFTLMQPYQGRMNVYHFDLYRLSSPDEVAEAGLEEYLFGDGVALVEWPFNGLEDKDATGRVDIHVRDTGEREIQVWLSGRDAQLAQLEEIR